MALKGFPGLPPLDRISPASDETIKKIVNLENPEEFNDAVNKGFVEGLFVDSILTFDAAVVSFNGNVLIFN